MPRFFPLTGALCIGRGRDPFDLTRSIGQECNTVRPGCVVALSDGTVLDPPFDSTEIVGSGYGHWAACVYPTGDYRDSFGRFHANDSGTPKWRVPIAIGPDGSVCLRPFSNAFAEFVDAKGEVFLRIEEDIIDAQLLGGDKILYRRPNGELVTRGFSLDNIPDGLQWGWPRAVWFVNRYALLYQSYAGGCLVFDGRIIARGADFYRSDAIVFNNALHVAWSTQPQEYGVTPEPVVIPLPQWETVPIFRPTAPPVEPPPVHVPPPVEKPMDYLQIITSIRSKYPTPLGVRHWEFLVEVAQATGTLLYRKEDSNSVLIPALGKRVSLDIIGRGTLGNQYADILGNSEADAVPTFQLKSPADGEYIDVSDIVIPGAPAPQQPPSQPPSGNPPTVPPDSQQIAAILKSIEDLRADVNAIKAWTRGVA